MAVSARPKPRLGPFEVHREIGRGGMGSVWSGRHVEQGVGKSRLSEWMVRPGARARAFGGSIEDAVALVELTHPERAALGG